MKRKKPVEPFPHGSRPPRLVARHFIYELIKDTNLEKKKPIEVILTTFVDGYGNPGKRVSVPPFVAYNKLLLPGFAVYPTPENIEKYCNKGRDMNELYCSSSTVQRTLNVLSTLNLGVKMSKDNPWTLETWHIRTSFRRIGIYVPDEAITMPAKAISGPDMSIQGKEFYVTITINKTETVKVRCTLHHYTTDINNMVILEEEHWLKPGEPIFEEDRAVLDSMPRHRLIQKAQEKQRELESAYA